MFVALLVLPFVAAAGREPSSRVVIDARVPASSPLPLPFPAGGESPDHHLLGANNRFLTLDGKPWFPIMGEFHFSRYRADRWEEEILKMKAGGIQVISTYVFWIHHEEIEGRFDWSGQRDLHHFVELCARHGMYVWVRVGPWGHGEARNGGLPDWLLKQTPTRQNSPIYLEHVRQFYGEIGKQLDKLFWKDGGPIIGVQIENEYSARGPGKGAEHILKLRQLALDAGMVAPFYTITGWDNAVIPPRDVLPVFGGYADGFWWRSLTDLPPNPNYFFTNIRCQENFGDNLQSKRLDIDALDAHYPFLTSEMGSGMANSYHRRPLMSADDAAAMELVKLGSGVVLYGYYMFHGGTNPDGRLTTLQESRATGYPNDLPVKSYDFQAPIGEFGQTTEAYRVLKTFHLFLSDFGSSLAPMTSYYPKQGPKSIKDTSTPRVAARLEGDHGFVFINNYERKFTLSKHDNFQIKLKLASGEASIPRRPITIPTGAYTMWPVNLDVGGTRLRYATAQLLCKLDVPQTYVFFAWPGIKPEFAFEAKSGVAVEASAGKVTRKGNVVYVDEIQAGTGVAIRTGDASIIVLSREQALNAWKQPLAGRVRLLLSASDLYVDQGRVHVVGTDISQLTVGVFPAFETTPTDFESTETDGVYKVYAAHVPRVSVAASVKKLSEQGPDPPAKFDKEVVLVPDDSAFDTAPSWSMDVPPTQPGADPFLKIAYEGDIARLYADGKLLVDNFYNGKPWVVGLNELPAEARGHLQLKVLPLRDHAPIYLPEGARPMLPAGGKIANIKSVQVVVQYEVVMDVRP